MNKAHETDGASGNIILVGLFFVMNPHGIDRYFCGIYYSCCRTQGDTWTDFGSRYYYWTNHWVESNEDGYGPCTGGDFVCSRDLDGVPPYVGGNGSGGFCSHDPDGSARANQGLGSLHRNLYDHDISNPLFSFYLMVTTNLKYVGTPTNDGLYYSSYASWFESDKVLCSLQRTHVPVLDYHCGSGTNCTYSVCERWEDNFMSGIYGCECRWNASDSYEYAGSQPTCIFMHLATLQVTISLWDQLMVTMVTLVYLPGEVSTTLDVLRGSAPTRSLVLCNGRLSSS